MVYDYSFTQPRNLLHRYGDPTGVFQLAQGPRSNNYLRSGYDGGGMTWEELLNFNKDKGPIPTGRSRGQGSTEGTNIQFANPFKNWNVFGGTNKTAEQETKKPGQGYYDFFGQTPGDTARMYADIAQEGKEFDLKNKLKLGMIDNISKLGANLGMGGAQYEYQAALEANKNSAYITANSKMNLGPLFELRSSPTYL
jgi:hypothetical protein